MLIVVVTDWIWMHLLVSLLASCLSALHSLAPIHWKSGAPLLASPNISHPLDELRKIIMLPRRNQDPCQKGTSRAWFGGCGAAQPHEFSQVWGSRSRSRQGGLVPEAGRALSPDTPAIFSALHVNMPHAVSVHASAENPSCYLRK